MNPVKKILHYFLYFGVKPSLNEGKKLAIQLATLDVYWSIVAIAFYIHRSIGYKMELITWSYSVALMLVFLGLYFFRKGYYDRARILVHLTTLSCIFLGADSAGIHSGAEYYYYTSIAIPFVIFTPEEQWKGNLLALIAGLAFISQLIVGPGLLGRVIPGSLEDRIVAAIFVAVYFLLIFGVGRQQLSLAHKEIERRNNELIQSSKMIALGELSSGIAHEINNPLQSLSLQLKVMKERFPDPALVEQLEKLNNLIFKMATMVKGLKDLARDSAGDPDEEFLLGQCLDDVLLLARNRFQEERIAFSIHGEQGYLLQGKQVQLSQVLINLVNNAIDAVRNLPEKWIRIDILNRGALLEIRVSDSGRGIPDSVKEKMMNPFFTTKSPSKGTGLGLAISKNLVDRNGGTLFYDHLAERTTFVIFLPLSKG